MAAVSAVLVFLLMLPDVLVDGAVAAQTRRSALGRSRRLT
jgi:hypothetical protein